ncbi:bile acid:sodium symporter family protein [Hydrogenophaga sp. OTU3427]|uniref:bile acid:sodium symporter family protein n=1 Tax=Hydrogenophaga sp. OTU3427 TaxID=3043856 RepID=UPI00313D884E
MPRSVFLPDKFTLSLVAAVGLASTLPARGVVADVLGVATTLAVGLLFLLHGARLSRHAILDGLLHWRLHLLVFACGFVLYTLLGLALRPVLLPLVTPALYKGVLYLCVLPGTVQSAITFVSMARGNVPAAICNTSASTMLGVFITPLLVGFIVVPGAAAASSFDSIGRILIQLMVPFVVGHLLLPWIGGWASRHEKTLKLVDQGSILLVVFTAFSAAVVGGLWGRIPTTALGGLVLVCLVLLALALLCTTWLARRLRFNKADEIAIVFCASTKGLASGIAIASVLFSASVMGMMVLPIMLFHQIQLMVGAVLARRYPGGG